MLRSKACIESAAARTLDDAASNSGVGEILEMGMFNEALLG